MSQTVLQTWVPVNVPVQTMAQVQRLIQEQPELLDQARSEYGQDHPGAVLALLLATYLTIIEDANRAFSDAHLAPILGDIYE